MFVFSEKAYVIHHMAALVQSSRATASFRIPAGSFHSCQPTRKKARVMDKIRGRNKAITMHSTPVYRGQGRIYANKRILPIPIHEISLYFGINLARPSNRGGPDFENRAQMPRLVSDGFETKLFLRYRASSFDTATLLQSIPGSWF